MKNLLFFAAALLLSVVSINDVAAVTHSGFEVKTLHSGDTRKCTFFQLNGVSEADPVRDNPWFAVSHDHYGHDVAVGILLTAFATKKKLTVNTTGAEVCDHAEVKNIYFHY